MADEDLDIPGARRRPVQRRSADRVDRILAAAEQLLLEGGVDALRMSDVARRADMSIGSLYQYFTERTGVIAALARRYNAIGVACVDEILRPVSDQRSLEDALCAVIDGYYDLFRSQPVMREIWAGSLTSRELEPINQEDCEAHARMIASAFMRAGVTPLSALEQDARLLSLLIDSVVRHAAGIDETSADVILSRFKDKVVAMFCGSLPPEGPPNEVGHV